MALRPLTRSLTIPQTTIAGTKPTTRTVLGADLRVGDTIEVWWTPNRDLITSLRPYNGPLAHLFPHGAQLAEFALLRSGMTIDNGDEFELVSP